MLVDDDPHFLKLTGFVVSKAWPDFEIVRFSSAIPALEFLSHQRAELIITDVRMPVMDGLRFTAAVRAADATVPIVVLSSEDRREAALACGATTFLPKSAVTTQLASTLASLGLSAPDEKTREKPTRLAPTAS